MLNMWFPGAATRRTTFCCSHSMPTCSPVFAMELLLHYVRTVTSRETNREVILGRETGCRIRHVTARRQKN